MADGLAQTQARQAVSFYLGLQNISVELSVSEKQRTDSIGD